jgi:non-reducing end alpha-L-arabinofuranosidase
MKYSAHRFAAMAFIAVGSACSTNGTSDTGVSGGRDDGSGGASATGGALSGGGAAVSGGTSATGGAAAGGATGSGGVPGSGGGTPVTGGANASGGVATGGQAASGGITGGVTSTGGGGRGGRQSSGGVTAAGGTVTGGVSAGGAGPTGGVPGTGGSTGAGGGAAQLPCDIYEAGSTPCVAAHSTVRALYAAYSGKLYQVRRESDKTTKDIETLTAGGFADGNAQDTFCAGGGKCTLVAVYDQSGKGNDVWYQGSDVVPGSTVSIPATATKEAFTASGHKVYSLYIDPNVCYWRDGSKTGLPLGDAPEGMYMVTSGKHYNAGCCFDYGNSETSRMADGAGTMDSINWGNLCWGGFTCQGSGPWVQADLEWGLFNGGNSNKTNPDNVSFNATYVTAILKNNGKTEWQLRGGDAQSGSLKTLWKGALPGGYTPMKKQGAITLGCGGDCCKPGGGANASAGTFYEGAIVAGYPSDATEDAIQANIVGAGYGQ